MTGKIEAVKQNTNLKWDIGTGYELFISLSVVHQPETYGLRASWAAGIRSRIPAVERKLLEDALPFLGIPVIWLYNLPGEKDAASVLWAIRQILPAERIKTIFTIDEWDEPEFKLLMKISDKRGWDEDDFTALRGVLCKEDKPGRDDESIKRFLDLWKQPEQFGEIYLSALQSYYQDFFAEEEQRIAPILRAGQEHALELSKNMELQELLVELSQGVHVEPFYGREVILVPAYWITPLLMQAEINKEGKNTIMYIYGVRPANMSVVPGEIVPEGLLRALKALADPTRLKIIYYLSKEELAPSELARRLHLRAPTVTHHLSELRLAGLLNLTLKGQDKRYTARREALADTFMHLNTFLDNSHDVSDPKEVVKP